MFGNIQYWIGLVVGTIMIYLALPKKEKRRVTWVVFSLIPAAIFAFQLSHVLKLWLQVPRPCVGEIGCPSTYSLPSNHASVIFAFAVVTAINIRKRLVWLVCVALAVLVSISRVALGYHTPLDIMIGSLIGIFCGFIIQKTYKTFPYVENSRLNRQKHSTKRGLSRFF